MATHAGDQHATTAPDRVAHGRSGHGRTAHATHHGNSVAAWTLVILVMLGALLGSIGVSIPSIAFVVVGAVVVVIGLVAGKVLSLAGYGSVKPADPEVPHGVS